MITVTANPINVQEHYEKLGSSSQTGAIVTFVGLVRDINQGASISSMALEHYPGMTEKVLEGIVQEACERWELLDVELVHRVGDMGVSDTIVFVGVSSVHRENAFQACAFIMDFLKTKAPFWKKEQTPDGSHWVEANNKDNEAASRW
ncbi:MAG: molybdopterin synthase catalytic subunit MoaE [Kangiellaceae bacterium]|nr:molybdopterin synthase catalytic subunit MoaE [Kangiellaceae bacterium]|tara:strand:- start:4423 stop:4863 length:441 start_codon:yes stop_codon:yes gene_type:complete